MRSARIVSLVAVLAGAMAACARGSTPGGFVSPGEDDDVPYLGGETVKSDCVTKVSGTVFAPNGKDPIYNAIVFVPTAPLEPLTKGAKCERCNTVSGNPRAATVSEADGHFELDVPSGDGVQLGVQLGKWRRAVTLPHVTACTNTRLDPDLTRLPRSHTEGDIPLHAVSTGSCDRLECVLRKMGVSDAEFTVPSGPGRVHMYRANGGTLPGIPSADDLTSDAATLNKYDLVLFDCAGEQDDKTYGPKKNVVDYSANGGRVYASHFSYVWLYDIEPFASTGQWRLGKESPQSDRVIAQVDTSNTAGAAFARWMAVTGALGEGVHQIEVMDPRFDLVEAYPPSQRWIYTEAPQSVQEYTFNTPVGARMADQCGKVSFSDFHVTGEGCVPDGLPFPDGCDEADAPITPQERVFEWMLLDLASCVQPFAPPVQNIR
jgi:hypothetical protein